MIVPADYHDTVKAVKAVAAIDGPCYIRFGRAPMPVVTKKEDDFVVGKGNKYRDGKDVTIFSMGAMLCIFRRPQMALMPDSIRPATKRRSTISNRSAPAAPTSC